MALFNRIVAALALVVAFAAPALAQELSAAQRDALAARIDSFGAAMQANDMNEVMGVVPPKILEKIAATYNVTTEQLIEAAQQQIDAAMATVKLESFGMDLESAEIVLLEDGVPYALIPTETVMDLGADGGKLRATSTTLGLLEGETWYLVRVEDPQQVQILKEVYPAFAGVEFPAGSMEPVTE